MMKDAFVLKSGHQAPLVAGFRLSPDHSVRFPDSAAFVAGSFQAFVGDFRPEFFELPRGRLVCVPFGVIRSPRHWSGSRNWLAFWTVNRAADAATSGR